MSRINICMCPNTTECHVSTFLCVQTQRNVTYQNFYVSKHNGMSRIKTFVCQNTMECHVSTFLCPNTTECHILSLRLLKIHNFRCLNIFTLIFDTFITYLLGQPMLTRYLSFILYLTTVRPFCLLNIPKCLSISLPV